MTKLKMWWLTGRGRACSGCPDEAELVVTVHDTVELVVADHDTVQLVVAAHD